MKVVGVHGISQQQAGRNQLLAAWQPALADGVERAAGRDGPRMQLDLAYYGDLFLASRLTKGVVAEAGAELDDDLLAFFADVEDEIVDEEPTREAVKGFKELPEPVARLAGWLEGRFGVAGRLLFFGDLAQVRRYQRDDALAAEARSRVEEAVTPQTRAVIGHSLGSVVAYETLCLHPALGIETLITLGSPLSLRSIREALRPADGQGPPPWPPSVKRWVNVRDANDPVTCGGGLAQSWNGVADELVDNGNDPHLAVRYLGKQPTGAALVAAR
jgi:hypothetical protein